MTTLLGRGDLTRSTLTLGTRASALALTQSQLVADAIQHAGDVTVTLVEVRTEGDRTQAMQAPLDLIGGTGVFVTARLVPMAGSYSLEDGVLAGKWSSDDVLKQLSGLRIFGQQLCPGSDPYVQLASKVCSTADIALFDGSPTDPCTAISVGVSYRATPAKLGVVVDQPDPASDCKTPFDPAKHGCSAL